MSQALLKEFEFVRSRLFKSIEETSPEVLDIQPQGFNNTLHWHVGHMLTIAENFLFAGNQQIPEKYNEFLEVELSHQSGQKKYRVLKFY